MVCNARAFDARSRDRAVPAYARDFYSIAAGPRIYFFFLSASSAPFAATIVLDGYHRILQCVVKKKKIPFIRSSLSRRACRSDFKSDERRDKKKRGKYFLRKSLLVPAIICPYFIECKKIAYYARTYTYAQLFSLFYNYYFIPWYDFAKETLWVSGWHAWETSSKSPSRSILSQMGELAAWHPWYITANQRGPRVREVIYVVYRSRLPIIASALASRSLLRLHARGKRKVSRVASCRRVKTIRECEERLMLFTLQAFAPRICKWNEFFITLSRCYRFFCVT